MKKKLRDLRLKDLKKIATHEKLPGRSKHKTKEELIAFLKDTVPRNTLKNYISKFPLSRASPKYLKEKAKVIPLDFVLKSRSVVFLKEIAAKYGINLDLKKNELIDELLEFVDRWILEKEIREYPILPSYREKYQKKEDEFKMTLKECKTCKKIEKQKFPCRKKNTIFWTKKDMEEWCKLKEARKTGNKKYRKLIAEWATQDWLEDPEYFGGNVTPKTRKRVKFE